eukprot:TRINITY_DN1890_c0_g1_i4.p1 TRINITY_DN1890_c0_g1~~TRINITY_DN1890_c0_g1_i4.p1  ORF type:complete len:857 (-),score=192.25 TRINITY_DN1890_c0_g1_i4:114-2684(-)
MQAGCEEEQTVYQIKDFPDGTYHGGILNGEREGLGIFFWNSGDVYYGHWSQNYMNGLGSFYFVHGGSLQGYFSSTLVTGPGKLTLPNGSIYIGSWVDGYQHGEGIYYNACSNTWNFGIFDLGKLREKKEIGQGYPSSEDISRLIPEYYSNIEVLQSKCEEDSYDGPWRNGMKEGIGIFSFKDGSKYQGAWENDYPNGLGIFQHVSGRIDAGFFKDGALNGVGRILFSNQSFYYGSFIEGRFEGTGILYNASKGEWIYADFKDNQESKSYERSTSLPPPSYWSYHQESLVLNCPEESILSSPAIIFLTSEEKKILSLHIFDHSKARKEAYYQGCPPEIKAMTTFQLSETRLPEFRTALMQTRIFPTNEKVERSESVSRGATKSDSQNVIGLKQTNKNTVIKSTAEVMNAIKKKKMARKMETETAALQIQTIISPKPQKIEEPKGFVFSSLQKNTKKATPPESSIKTTAAANPPKEKTKSKKEPVVATIDLFITQESIVEDSSKLVRLEKEIPETPSEALQMKFGVPMSESTVFMGSQQPLAKSGPVFDPDEVKVVESRMWHQTSEGEDPKMEKEFSVEIASVQHEVALASSNPEVALSQSQHEEALLPLQTEEVLLPFHPEEVLLPFQIEEVQSHLQLKEVFPPSHSESVRSCPQFEGVPSHSEAVRSCSQVEEILVLSHPEEVCLDKNERTVKVETSQKEEKRQIKQVLEIIPEESPALLIQSNEFQNELPSTQSHVEKANSKEKEQQVEVAIANDTTAETPVETFVPQNLQSTQSVPNLQKTQSRNEPEEAKRTNIIVHNHYMVNVTPAVFVPPGRMPMLPPVLPKTGFPRAFLPHPPPHPPRGPPMLRHPFFML